ncbi:glutathione S-transferase [Aspergillus avenaceus]|uniref:glutathione transferase n=1 Tax=Aspergillus avenaceus TaxID=36643 RepID=A0A5N6TV06_ASPAV|nr:glutathione S-transferase [Aspergillus avenaceus]
MSLQPIKLYGHANGPNPWKVALLLSELGVPHEIDFMQMTEVKKEPYILKNPNGRLPTIEDPNTGIVLWESGAILEYLVETYDKERKFSFEPGTHEYFHTKQWLHFQMSGQGPYFGQAVWFSLYHPEKIESARVRYINEIRRVSEVLNTALAGREWLVGGKFTYADVAFITWFGVIPWITGDEIDMEKDLPNLYAWLQRMKARPAIAETLKRKEEINAKESK